MITNVSITAVLFVPFSVMVCTRVLAGTMSYVSQERTVVASLLEDYGAEDPRNNTDREEIGAPDFGLFDATTLATIGLGGSSSTKQTSKLEDERVSFAGAFTGQTESYAGFYTNESWLEAIFQTTTSTSYSLHSLAHSNWSLSFPAQIEFDLKRLDIPTSLISETMIIDAKESNVLDRNGSLPAGLYRLFVKVWARNDTGMSGDYAVEFDVTPKVAIPLPPMVWTALMVMFGLVVVLSYRPMA